MREPTIPSAHAEGNQHLSQLKYPKQLSQSQYLHPTINTVVSDVPLSDVVSELQQSSTIPTTAATPMEAEPPVGWEGKYFH